MDREKIEEMIREVAYELYIKSGRVEGRDLDNWLEAEKIVLERLRQEQASVTNSELPVKKKRGRKPKVATEEPAQEKKSRRGKAAKSQTTKRGRRGRKKS